MPGQGKARATLTIDQANLGRETIGPVRLALVRSDEKLEIQEFRLGLPGASRAELQGQLSASSQGVAFDGSLGLRGSSAARFVAWATGNALSVDAKGDGPFGVRSRLVIGGGKIAAHNVVGNLSGTALYGSAHYRWEGRPELAIALRRSADRCSRPCSCRLQPRRHVWLPAARAAYQDRRCAWTEGSAARLAGTSRPAAPPERWTAGDRRPRLPRCQHPGSYQRRTARKPAAAALRRRLQSAASGQRRRCCSAP